MAQMSNVSSAHGAPMGRPHVPGNGFPEGKVRLFRVRLDAGGYDDGGAYWGHGARLYCARDENGNERFARAPDRATACEKLGLDPKCLARPLTERDQ